MKKAYSRPDIIFEDFSLSTSIAAGCTATLDNPTENVCGLKFDNTTVFLDAVYYCQTANGGTPVDDGKVGDGVCYHVPETTNNLFNS